MKKDLLICTAFSAFLAGSAATAEGPSIKNAATEIKGKCFGINACKAKGECATKTNSCHYKNSCKGKGWVSKTQKECNDLKGKFEAN